MNITPGDIVAFQCLGDLGHLAIQYVRKMGYRTVALSSIDAKRDVAMKLGATDDMGDSKEDSAAALHKIGGASMAVVTAPNRKVMTNIVNVCVPSCKVLILSCKLTTQSITIDIFLIVAFCSGRRITCRY